MDQKTATQLQKFFGFLFIFFGLIMTILGLSLLFSNDKSEIEYFLLLLFLVSGTAFFIGGFGNIQKAKTKMAEIEVYELQLKNALQESGQQSTITEESKNKDQNIESLEANSLKKNEILDEFKPDLIATIHYTPSEWKYMRRTEQIRRFKEGYWVTILIALIGGWYLSNVRDESILFSIIFCFGIGLLISILKVFMSNSLFSMYPENIINITSNALLINGKFKTLSDNNIQLEYVKAISQKGRQFLEFSLQWPTRNGYTNDQIRILIPDRHADLTSKVLNYYQSKNIQTTFN